LIKKEKEKQRERERGREGERERAYHQCMLGWAGAHPVLGSLY
jgi:hypothetical protein